MDDAQRARVAAEAIREAETLELLHSQTRRWQVEVRCTDLAPHEPCDKCIRFLDVRDGRAIDRPVEEVIAELMVDAADAKRRAERMRSVADALALRVSAWWADRTALNAAQMERALEDFTEARK